MTNINYHVVVNDKTIADSKILNKIVDEVLLELTISTFNELVRNADVEKALKAVEPFTNTSALFIQKELTQRNLLKSNGPDALLLCWMFAQSCVAESVEGEIKEKGAVGRCENCLFKKDGSPEQCIAISHFGAARLCELLNPNYECIWTHHVTNGDPYCRYVFKKKLDHNKDFNDLGKTLFVMPKITLTEEEHTAMKRWALSNFFWMNTIAFVSLNGSDRTVENLGRNAYRIGKNVGRQMKQLNNSIDGSPITIGNIVHSIGTAIGRKESPIVISDSEYSVEITACPDQTLEYETCKQFEALFKGLCEEINPELDFYYDRMLTKGDNACHWVIKKKSAPSNSPSTKMKNEEGDLLKALTKKFVLGEITKEEYDRMAGILGEED